MSYGWIYKWLTHRSNLNAGMQSLIETLVAHAKRKFYVTTRVRSATDVQRQKMSMAQARRLTGKAGVSIKRFLADGGNFDSSPGRGQVVSIDRDAINELTNQLKTTVRRVEAEKLLGIPYATMRILLETGLIAPSHKAGGWTRVDRFDLEDVKRFINRMVPTNTPVLSTKPDHLLTAEVIWKTLTSSRLFYQLLHAGSIAVTARTPNSTGLGGILVDRYELTRELLIYAKTSDVPRRTACLVLCTSMATVERLIKAGHLKISSISPELVSSKDIANLKRMFIGISEMGERLGGIDTDRLRKQRTAKAFQRIGICPNGLLAISGYLCFPRDRVESQIDVIREIIAHRRYRSVEPS